jgi:hypothetical protein
MYSIESELMFRCSMPPPSSGSENTPSKKPVYLPDACFFLGFLSNPENGSDMFLRNVGSLPTDYMAL